MKKPTEKRIKYCSRDVEKHFKVLVDAIIYYDLHEMDDWAYEIIGFIEDESHSNDKIFQWLLNDLKHRTLNDFDVYFYSKLWWALIYEQDMNVIDRIVSSVKDDKNIMLHTFLTHSLNQLNEEDDDDEDCENTNKFYLEDILKKINS